MLLSWEPFHPTFLSRPTITHDNRRGSFQLEASHCSNFLGIKKSYVYSCTLRIKNQLKKKTALFYRYGFLISIFMYFIYRNPPSTEKVGLHFIISIYRVLKLCNSTMHRSKMAINYEGIRVCQRAAHLCASSTSTFMDKIRQVRIGGAHCSQFAYCLAARIKLCIKKPYRRGCNAGERWER